MHLECHRVDLDHGPYSFIECHRVDLDYGPYSFISSPMVTARREGSKFYQSEGSLTVLRGRGDNDEATRTLRPLAFS